MWRDLGWRSLARSSWQLLRLELRLMTGGRPWLLLAIELAWVGLMTLWQHAREQPFEPQSFYVSTIVLPSLVPAIVLGMPAVLAERDMKHLEMSFASAGGRYMLWSFRLAALAVMDFVSCGLLAACTWLLLARDLAPWSSALHAFLPVYLASVLAVFLSLLLNGSSMGGIGAVTALVVGVVLPRSISPWTNPFDPPPSAIDSGTWTRTVVDNRLFLVAAIAACIALSLGLLQRRERLL